MKNSLAKTQLLINKKHSRISLLFIAGLIIFTAFMIASSTVTVNAQKALKGEWSAQINSEKPNMLFIMFTRRPNITSINQTSRYITLNEVQGLTAQTISSDSPSVNFTLARSRNF